MTKKIQSIQERLNEKSDKALREKLDTAKSMFSAALKPCSSDYISISGEENETKKSIYDLLCIICNHTFEKRRDSCRALESQEFIARIDSIAQDVDQIREEVGY